MPLAREFSECKLLLFSVLQAQVALLLDGMAVFDRTIKVSMARGGAGPGVVRSNDPDRVQRTVHVGGLPMEELSETVLADFFQNVGEVKVTAGGHGQQDALQNVSC